MRCAGLFMVSLADNISPLHNDSANHGIGISFILSFPRQLNRPSDKLLIVVAADLAKRRLEKGVLLNYPESVALITAEIMEGARMGRTVSELMTYGTQILSADQVMDGIPAMIHEVQVEATFPDGTKLVTVHHPIRSRIDA